MAIGHAAFDVQLIENVGEVSFALGALELCLFLNQPVGMLRREIIIGISEQCFCGSHEFGIRIAFAERRTSRRRSHGVHIRIVKESRMGVMIEDWNLFNLRQNTLINLLYVCARQGTSLSEGCDCSA